MLKLYLHLVFEMKQTSIVCMNDSLIFLYKTGVSDLCWFNSEVTHFILHLQLNNK